VIKKTCFIILLLSIVHGLNGQNIEKTKLFVITPELNTKVNGIGIGLMINSLKFEGDTTTTIINGLNVELVGVGFFAPLAPSNPLIPDEVKIEQIAPILDSLIIEATQPKPYKINGLNISLGGLAGHEIQLDGLNISGIATLTSKTNGVSIAILMNLNKVMHGISAGFINQCLEHKGLQIGVFNQSEKTKGIQIGLWNKNEKRSLPLINWNF
jgi:hypothetical protein